MVALRDFVFAFCLLLSVAAAQRTVDDIFNNINKNYNKNVMPPSRRGQPVMVGITVNAFKVFNAVIKCKITNREEGVLYC